MKRSSKTFIILSALLLALFMISCSKTKVVSNGKYSYSITEGDPLKTRIYTLDNGLTVYTSVYKDAPRIQTAVAIKVGHKNDPADKTGMAHYLEHLLFKGTDEYGSLDWDKEKIEIQNLKRRVTKLEQKLEKIEGLLAPLKGKPLKPYSGRRGL